MPTILIDREQETMGIPRECSQTEERRPNCMASGYLSASVPSSASTRQATQEEKNMQLLSNFALCVINEGITFQRRTQGWPALVISTKGYASEADAVLLVDPCVQKDEARWTHICRKSYQTAMRHLQKD